MTDTQQYDLLDLLTYPRRPGYRDHSTSREAATKMASRAATLRETVLQLLREYPSGLTVHEGVALVELTYPSITVAGLQPRFSELVAMGKIKRSGERRRNKSGMSAAVWIIK